jgi:AraC family transcriptional regulator of adaptative response / DNA-3-methyladenine glycosylase II
MTTIARPSQAIWADHARAYRAVQARDARFDGCFIVAVRTTGIYCRPSCPAVTPKAQNTTFHPTAAAAQSAGYRACRRCLPDAVPGSAEWDLRADLAGRAMRLITDGTIERCGVAGLAATLGYSERHLTRVLTEQLGAGPLALARAHRAQAARVLIETSTMSFADIAFAAGFRSVRQFNDTIQAVYATTPTRLRTTRRGPLDGAAGAITVRLPYRRPMDVDGVFEFLAARAVTGIEQVMPGGYARTLRLPSGPATVTVTAEAAVGHLRCTLRLTSVRDLGTAVSRVRRIFDLDADPVAIDTVLGADSSLTASVAATPGIRVPGSVDATELLLRALLGQQVSVAAARTALARLVADLGEPLDVAQGSLTTLFPTAEAIAEHGTDVLRGPRRRVESVLSVARAIASGELSVHLGRDAGELAAELRALPGIGPWTAGYAVMRLLGAPDELLTGDLVLRKGAAALGLPAEERALRAHSRRWQPWSSYAGMHLWRAANGELEQR